ncbi:hypothetical protein BRADI_1g17725v3 [Brachypodium distachyon]|uniref:Uncharacterized protein n=1 Tax=Brachypodium distachyon TaxID=15368 RepID=A0A2K2DJW7_BRADI|nr:hypothetical protein BRADI_1g17725v3 [Brachypodium distachyon]
MIVHTFHIEKTTLSPQPLRSVNLAFHSFLALFCHSRHGGAALATALTSSASGPLTLPTSPSSAHRLTSRMCPDRSSHVTAASTA